jgi:hypothetical protein
MALTLALLAPVRRHGAGRRAPAGPAAPREPAPAAPAPVTPTASARRAGGPEDRALYTCSCGHTFTATVSASVGCPHCGADQAW